MSRDTDISIGDGWVTVRRHGRSTSIVAKILGEETRKGIRTIWLDRLVHYAGEKALGEWNASGAISTILSRDVKETGPS